MDYQKFVDGFELTTCIISVEKFDDGSYGNIRIVAGNKPYIDSIENPYNGAAAHMLNNKFIPGSPYEKYIPKDLNFEQTCYRCAFMKKPVHTYLKPERFNCWINQYIMPVESDEPNIGYCSYTLDITMEADTEIMTNLSASTASSVLETCIKLRGTADFKKSINDVISDICDLCGAKMCTLLLVDDDTESCSVLAVANRFEHHIPDHTLVIDDSFYSVAKTWEETIAGSNCLIIQGEQDMKILEERNKLWHDSLKSVHAETLVLFPLRQGDKLLGYIYALNFDPSKAQKIKETLELTTYFIASEIANHQLLKQLATLSAMDLLTGIFNRNAMNGRIDRFVSGKEAVPKDYGIIFADLNGLKTVNDNEGHIAGDTMLKNAAEKLKSTFSDCDIYRAGGDEFMLIAAAVPENELVERIEKLRAEAEDPNVISFALGLYYEHNGGDIRAAMKLADEKMYEDKENYYNKYPERKRK